MAKYDLLPVGNYQNKKELSLDEKLASSGIDLSKFKKPESSFVRRALGDRAIAATKGAIGFVEGVTGLGDLATGGMVGKGLENIGIRFKDAKAGLDEYYSPEQQEANRKVQEAEGFTDTVIESLKNPSTILDTVIESAPSILGGGVYARLLGKAGVLANNPVARGAIGEGLVGAAQSAEQIRQENPDGLLTGKQSLASLASGATTGAIGFGGGRLAQKYGFLDPQTVLAGGNLPKGLSKKTFGNVIKGFVSEGALQELPQSATEQMWQNYAQDKPLFEGVPEAAATGLLAGGVLGGGANLISSRGRTQREATQPTNSPPSPDLPQLGYDNPNNPNSPNFNPNLAGRYDPVTADLQNRELNQNAYSPIAETLARGVNNNLPAAPTGTISKALMAGGFNQEMTTRPVLEGELVDALPAELQQAEAIDNWLEGNYRNIPANQLNQNLNRLTYNPDLDENGNLPRLYAPNSRAREITVEQLRDIVRNINTDNITPNQLMAYTGSNHIQAAKAIREVKQEVDTLRKDFDSLSQANKALSKLADKSSFEVGRLANDRFAILPRGVNSVLPDGFVARGRAIVAKNPTSPPTPQRKSLVQRNNTINDLHTRVPQETVDAIADNYQGNISPMQLMTESGGSYSQALTSLRRFAPTVQENVQPIDSTPAIIEEPVQSPVNQETVTEPVTEQATIDPAIPDQFAQPVVENIQVEQTPIPDQPQAINEQQSAEQVNRESQPNKETSASKVTKNVQENKPKTKKITEKVTKKKEPDSKNNQPKKQEESNSDNNKNVSREQSKKNDLNDFISENEIDQKVADSKKATKALADLKEGITGWFREYTFKDKTKETLPRNLIEVAEAANLSDAQVKELAERFNQVRLSSIEAESEEALYRRGKSNNPASNAENLRNAISNRIKQWKNAPKFEVVQSISDLPETLRNKVFKSEAYDANGIHFNGQVYLIADNISNPKQALFVTEHEVLGHYGLRGLFGNSLNPILNSIYKNNLAVRTQADSKTKLYGYDKTLATEEVLADMAASKVIQNMPFWNKLVAAFRSFSRKLGLTAAWTNNDIAYLLGNARRFVEKGTNDNSTTGTQYSRVGQFVNAGLDWLNTKLDKSQQISDHVSPEQSKIMKEKFAMFQPKSIKDKVNEVSHNLGEKLIQGIFDSFAPLKSLNEEAYMQAHLSKGTEGAVEALLRFGKPKLTEGAYDVDSDGRGLFGVLSELNSNGGNELNEWLSWMAANRAEILKRQGRENLFTSEEIQELKKLNEGTMSDGRNRSKVYENVRKQFMEYNKAVLDIAEQSGLIDKANRKTWENGFYLPFYRIADEDSNFSIGSPNKIVGQQAFKKLKGGTNALDDLLVNIVSNWSHLLTASLKNQAGVKSLKSAVNMGVADKLDRLRAGEYINTSTDQFRKGGQNVVWVMENGQQEYYQVNDPLVFDALNMINHKGWNNPLINVMGNFKKYLTVGVTISPTFRVRNLIRDTLQAAAVANIDYNPIANVINGFNATKAGTETMNRLIAGGGAIRFGSMNDGNQGYHYRNLIKELDVKDQQILNTPDKVKNALSKAWEWYKETGDRGETINRAAIYEKAIADGKSHLQASFEARDLLNFTSAGKWASVRFLSQVLPFFNARLQGIYKLGRAANSDPKRFALVTGAVALASSLLYLLQKDDDDYKELPDWVRDTYWYVKLGDQALYIPKPFEIGALGSIAERGLEFALAGDDYTAGDFASTVTSILADQLAMNPVPQIAKPAIEAAFNYDTFRGAAIDSMGQERLAPRDRYTASTSTGAVLAGKALNISPQRIEHLARGYFGWLGTQALNVTDIATRPLTDLPSNPNRDLGQINNIFLLGDFVKKSEIGAGSKYLSRFYDSQSKIDQAYASLTNARKIGELEYAEELAKDDNLKLRRLYTTASNNISKISQQIRAVRADKKLTASEKTQRIDILQRQRNELAKMADKRARASGYL